MSDRQKVRYSRCFWFVCVVAWYTSSAAAAGAAGAKTDTIQVDKVAAAGLPVTVDFEFHTVTKPELSDADGKCYYMIDGEASPVLSSVGKSWGTYAIKVSTSDSATWMNALQSESKNTSVVTFNLTAGTPASDINIVLLNYAASPENDHSKTANVSTNHTIEVTFSTLDYSAYTIAVTKINGQAVSENPASSGKYTNAYALFGVRPKADDAAESYQSSYTDTTSKYLTVAATGTVNS